MPKKRKPKHYEYSTDGTIRTPAADSIIIRGYRKNKKKLQAKNNGNTGCLAFTVSGVFYLHCTHDFFVIDHTSVTGIFCSSPLDEEVVNAGRQTGGGDNEPVALVTLSELDKGSHHL